MAHTPYTRLSCAILLIVAGSTIAWGQDAAQPADAAPPAVTPAEGPVKITVIAATGKNRYRPSMDAPLQDLPVGAELKAGAEIFTAPSSIVQLQIGTGQVFTIDRLGRVIILSTGVVNGKETTLIQMPYGRVKFEITSTRVANDVKIQSPDATLAVKGTIGIMEVIPGQPTAAWGGDLNTGQFNIMYTGGLNVDVGKNYKSKRTQTPTAGTEDEETYVETKDPNTRDVNTRQSARWSPPGAFDEFSLFNHDLHEFPTDERFYDVHHESFDLRGGFSISQDAFSHNLAGDRERLSEDLPGFYGDPRGLAVYNDGDGFSLIGVNDGYFPIGLALTFGNGYGPPKIPFGALEFFQWHTDDEEWTYLGFLAPFCTEFTSGGNLKGGGVEFEGLGTLNSTLYASGWSERGCPNDTGNIGVFEMEFPSTLGGEFQAHQRMSFPMLNSTGGLTGANERGSMFMSGQMNTFLPGTDLTLAFSQTMVLLEIDPRNNYIINAWSGQAGDFNVQPTLSGPSDISVNVTDTGLAFSEHQVVITGNDGKFTYKIHFDPDASQHVTAHRGLFDKPSAIDTNALAGEGGNGHSSPRGLSAGGTLDKVYSGIDPLWLGAGYSNLASTSPTFQRMVAFTVVGMAQDPSGCANSTDLSNGLPTAMSHHVNQTGGVGQAIQEFHNSLDSKSPCALP